MDALELEARRAAERGLAGHPESGERSHRLERRVMSLDRPEQRALVYLREAGETGQPLEEDFVSRFGPDVAAALDLLQRMPGESDADVVLRSSQHPLAREVIANDVGEELDRLASAAGGIGEGTRWDFLILCQALLDRVAVGDDSDVDAQPVTVEAPAHTATVYIHPVHGDVVVLVRSSEGSERSERWLLIDRQHKDDLVLGLTAERLTEPLEAGLLPWLREKKIRHHAYDGEEAGEGTALA